MPQPPPQRPPRSTGFQRPWTSNQLVSWTGQVVCNALFYGLVGTVLGAVDRGDAVWTACLALTAVHLAIVTPSFGFFVFLETHDPTHESCFGRCLPSSKRWDKVKYCGVHKQKIVGLDHFCTWLNVSIGRSNYLPFILLVSLGLVQFGLQAATGLVMVTGWRSTIHDAVAVPWVFLLCAIVHEVLVVTVFVLYVMLWSFHCYLGVRGISTYDFLLEQNSKAASGGPDAKYQRKQRGSGTTTTTGRPRPAQPPAPAAGQGQGQYSQVELAPSLAVGREERKQDGPRVSGPPAGDAESEGEGEGEQEGDEEQGLAGAEAGRPVDA